MILSPRTIVALALLAGIPTDQAAVCAACALAESGGDTLALNPVAPDLSYGLWQINMIDTPTMKLGESRRKKWGLVSNAELYNAWTNVKAMRDVSARGATWQPWTTFTRGHYLKHLPATQNALKEIQVSRGTVDDVVAVALSAVGQREDGKNTLPLTRELDASFPPVPLLAGGTHTRSNTDWCGSFTLWALWKAGVPIDPAGALRYDDVFVWDFFTPSDVRSWQRAGRWLAPSLTPPVGALVYYRWAGRTELANHVGLVVGIHADGSIITVEGNVGPNNEWVASYGHGMQYPARAKPTIVGYGLPDYLTTPPDTGDLMYRYVTVPGANASFLGLFDSEGFCALLQWITDAETLRRWQYKAPVTLTFDQVRSMWVDRLPVGDAAHTWIESDFAGVGAPSVSGVDVAAIVAQARAEAVAAVRPLIPKSVSLNF